MTLEERLARLEDAHARLEAVHEIMNIMGRFSFYSHYGQWEQIVGLFAQHTPGVTSEHSTHGVYKGIEGVRRSWVGWHGELRYVAPGDSAEAAERNKKDRERVGRLTVHQTTTPVVEVAKDGKTAKGVWMSPGYAASRDAGGELRAYLHLGKLAADFVKEDGRWKIWHFHGYVVFRTPYELGWVKESGADFYEHGEADTKFPPDEPTTYHQMYDPTKRLGGVPPVPEPYDS